MLVELTLLIWNVHGLPFIGASPENVARVLEEHPADAYFLQEVFTSRMHRAIIKAIKPDSTTWQSRSGLLHCQKGGVMPAMMLAHDNYFRQTTYSRFDFLVRKGFISGINEHWVRVVNTHLDAGSDLTSALVRMQQFEEIMQSLRISDDSPVIIAGDLNFKMDRVDDRFAVKKLMEKYGLTGYWVNTDFVLLKNVELVDVKTVYTEVSDHFPLIVKVRYEADED